MLAGGFVGGSEPESSGRGLVGIAELLPDIKSSHQSGGATTTEPLQNGMRVPFENARVGISHHPVASRPAIDEGARFPSSRTLLQLLNTTETSFRIKLQSEVTTELCHTSCCQIGMTVGP
jgi:hypothetical protein